jgi:hypothetical protein
MVEFMRFGKRFANGLLGAGFSSAAVALLAAVCDSSEEE